MKFPQLQIGQRFNFKGQAYIKTGPLTANLVETGKSQLMMKSAEVAPLDSVYEPSVREKNTYSRNEVLVLLAQYQSNLTQKVLACANGKTHLNVDEVLELIRKQSMPG